MRYRHKTSLTVTFYLLNFFLKLIKSQDQQICTNPSQHFDETIGSCVDNVCYCRYGTVRSPCLTHNSEVCSNCLDSFELIDNICVKKKCSCENGIARSPANCLINNREECQACDVGFHLENYGDFDLCVQNVCSCENGQAKVGVDCIKHNHNICYLCDPGYSLQDSTLTCEEITCQCPYGVVDKVATCDLVDTIKCLSCDEGYRKVKEKIKITKF